MVSKKQKKSKKKRNIKIIRKCIECGSTKFYHDDKLKETSCLLCGLVLYAPYNYDFITDGFIFDKELVSMVSEKLQNRLKKLESENTSEIKITKRYIDETDTIFNVATYIYHNIRSSFFIIECELKYTTIISSNTHNYSFEVEIVDENRITNFNIKKTLKQKLDKIIDDVGYSNNITIENRIKKIIIQK